MESGATLESISGLARLGRVRALVLQLVMLLALLAFPHVVTDPFLLSLLTEILIFGIFAMSLDLLLGYSGMVSFGHAAFFGLGAYTAGVVGIRLSPQIFVTLPAALVLASLAALLIGVLVIRTAGVYFLMLTVALAQMVYSVVFQWTEVTGGSNGLSGVPRPTFQVGPLELDLAGSLNLYYLVVLFAVVSFLLMRMIVRSPFGHTMVGIRENENRMRAIGYDVARYKLVMFVIGGAFAGLAGALFAYFNNFVGVEQVYWTTSGLVMIMVIIGGAGTLVGPVLGAALVLLLQNTVSSYTERWLTIMGLVFILFVLLARQGIAGLWLQTADVLRRGLWKR